MSLAAQGARPLAGGTHLLASGLEVPNVLDLAALGLREVAVEDGDLSLGALVTLQEVIDGEVAYESTGGLLPAACRAQSPSRMIRGMATLGGESVRGAPDSEVAAALLALNAVYTVAHPEGTRESPALRFVKNPAEDLAGGGIVRAIVIPGRPGGAALERVAPVASAPPLVSVAVTVSFTGDTCGRCRIALTGLRTRPARVMDAESTIERSTGGAEALRHCIDHVAQAPFRDDAYASAGYRSRVARVLTLRALRRAIDQARRPAPLDVERLRPLLPHRAIAALPYFTSGRIELTLNGHSFRGEIEARTTLLDLLRRAGLHGARNACGTGECGACTVLLDAKPVCACLSLAVRAQGRSVQTVEGLGSAEDLHRVQRAFVDAAAARCGYCTPALELCAKALVDAVASPTEAEARDALAGCACPCTGHVGPIEAVLRSSRAPAREDPAVPAAVPRGPAKRALGLPVPRVDAAKLVTGRAPFADDVSPPRLLHARVLHSPHAHARVVRIDTSQARSMSGVAAVLTHEEVRHDPCDFGGVAPGVRPILDDVLRFVGDRVAVVAADDPDVAARACEAIQVEYELLDARFDPELADVLPGVSWGAGHGDLARGFAEAERTFEGVYRFPAARDAPLEPHVAIAWIDEDDRLVVRASSPSPFDVRRELADVLGLPLARVRVAFPRVALDAATASPIVVEDLCAVLALRTGRPVRLEQQEETRNVRPDQVVRVRSGLRDGRFTAIEMTLRSNAGAGPASPDDLRGPGEALGLYRCPNVGYEARAAATNLPPSGPLPVAAGSFAMESHVDEVAAALGEDPLELRRRNVVVEGDVPAFGVMGSCRLDEAIAKGAKAIGWGRKRKRGRANGRRRGLGMALSVRGSGPMGTAGAALRMNEDGSFQLALGHAVRGGGAETAAAQIVAETLQVDLGRIVVVTGETDMAPPGRGIPGFAATAGVAQAAARRVLEQLLETAARALGAESAGLVVEDGRVRRADGRAAAFTELAAHAAGTIEASASQPPEPRLGACAAVFAAVEVDEETGRVRVADLVEAVDCGLAVNPAAVAGRIEGDAVGALAHALHPVVSHDGEGRPAGRALRDAGRLTALETPSIEVALVGAPDPAAPLGVKSLGHVGSNAVAAAVANAVADALGARVRELPLSPERVLAAMERREPPGGERG